MRRSLWIAFILACPGLAAQAHDGMDLSQKSRLSAGAPVPSKSTQAPFTSARDPLAALMMTYAEERLVGLRSACENSSRDLCYDLAERRVVYRPVRQYMPRFEGLTAENVSLRHDKVVFKYSFR